jgi:hypothetical protein
MFAPLPWNAHNRSYPSSLVNGISRARCDIVLRRRHTNLFSFDRSIDRFARDSARHVVDLSDLSLSLPSYYPTLKRHSSDNESRADSLHVDETTLNSKQRSSIVSSPKMQQHTTNESANGVPSRLCSVCGDISTGINGFDELSSTVDRYVLLVDVRQASILEATAAKVAKRSFAVRFNVFVFKITNVRVKVRSMTCLS